MYLSRCDDAVGAKLLDGFLLEVLAVSLAPHVPPSDVGRSRSVASGLQGFDELFREALSRRVQPERLVERHHRAPGLSTSELVGAEAG